MRCSARSSILFGLILSVPGLAQAQDIGAPNKTATEKVFPKKLYSPYAGRNYPTRPFFGDTHLHTAASFDAGALGARLGARRLA